MASNLTLIRLRFRDQNVWVGKVDCMTALKDASAPVPMLGAHWWVPEERAKVWTRERDLRSTITSAIDYTPSERACERMLSGLELVFGDGSTVTLKSWYEKTRKPKPKKRED